MSGSARRVDPVCYVVCCCGGGYLDWGTVKSSVSTVSTDGPRELRIIGSKYQRYRYSTIVEDLLRSHTKNSTGDDWTMSSLVMIGVPLCLPVRVDCRL